MKTFSALYRLSLWLHRWFTQPELAFRVMQHKLVILWTGQRNYYRSVVTYVWIMTGLSVGALLSLLCLIYTLLTA